METLSSRTCRGTKRDRGGKKNNYGEEDKTLSLLCFVVMIVMINRPTV